jgi:hypothetical protein
MLKAMVRSGVAPWVSRAASVVSLAIGIDLVKTTPSCPGGEQCPLVVVLATNANLARLGRGVGWWQAG